MANSLVVGGPEGGVFRHDHTPVKDTTFVRVKYPDFDGLWLDTTHVSDVLDPILKRLRDHNEGKGSETEHGVVVDAAFPYTIPFLASDCKFPAPGLYGRLFWEKGRYLVKWFLGWEGKEHKLTISQPTKIDIEYIMVSMDKTVYDNWVPA